MIPDIRIAGQPRYGTSWLINQIRAFEARLPAWLDGLIVACAIPLILFWLVGEELAYWSQRISLRRLDRLATFATGWLIALTALYLALEVTLAILRHLGQGRCAW